VVWQRNGTKEIEDAAKPVGNEEDSDEHPKHADMAILEAQVHLNAGEALPEADRPQEFENLDNTEQADVARQLKKGLLSSSLKYETD
jgi:hypothetical protein